MNTIQLIIAGATAALSFAAVAQPYYRLTDLGSLSTTGESWASAINASGQVAGFSLYDELRRLSAGTRMQNGTVQNLGHIPSGYWSWAWAINDAGLAVGVSHKQTLFGATFYAFKVGDGAVTQLADLTAGHGTAALGVNRDGVIVGCADPGGDALGTFTAVRWTGNTVTNLGTLGGFNSHANAINVHGHIVGASELASGPFHAFRWVNGTRTDLGTLGGRASEAHDINDAGQIVGWAHLADGTRRAALWHNGAVSDLGTLGTSSEARATNEAGWVVGTSWVKGEGQRAFVRPPAGPMTNLRGRIIGAESWILQHATDINGAGVIVGYGRVNGSTRAFMLTPGACDADIDADGFLSGTDFDLFVSHFESGLAPADFDGDGFVTGMDYDLYVQSFETGC